MASRNFTDVQTLGVGRKQIYGAFMPNGAAAPTVLSSGHGWTVGAPTNGVYTITFTDPYVSVDGWSMDMASPVFTQNAQVTQTPTANNGAGGGGSMQITTLSSGSATNLGPAANLQVSFSVQFGNLNAY